MKKFLLPCVALMLSGAFFASAEEVEVRYFEVTYGDAAKLSVISDEGWMVPTMNNLVKGADGSYTLENFENSGADLKFSIGEDGKINYLNENIKGTGLQYLKDFGTKFNLETAKAIDSGTGIVPAGSVSIKNNTCHVFPGMPAGGYEIVNQTGSEMTYKVKIGTMVGAMFRHEKTGTEIRIYTLNACAVFEFTEALAQKTPNVDYTDASGNESLKSSFSDIEVEAGVCTVKNFAGSAVDLVFKPGAGKDGKAALVFSAGGLNSEENADTYQTLTGATCNLQKADGTSVTGPVSIRPSGCYAEVVENGSSLQYSDYTVHIDAKFGDVACFAVLSAEKLSAMSQGELVDFSIFADYRDGAASSSYKWYIDQIDEENYVIYNFLNTGLNIPVKLGEKSDGLKDYANTSETFTGRTFGFPEDYCLQVSGSNYRLRIPGEKDLVPTAKFIGKSNAEVVVEDPKMNTNSLYSHLRYYDENGTVRKNFQLLFSDDSGLDNYKMTWDMYEGGSSSLDDIVVDENAPVEYYNLQGMRVNRDNLAPGIYIRHQGGKSVKVYVK